MPRQRIVALFLMLAGFGWVAGDFVQPDNPLLTHVLITIIHAVPVVLASLFALPLMQRRDGGPPWALRGVTALAAFYTIVYAGIIAYSVAKPDPDAFGVHSLGDWEAATVMIAGNLLLLASVAPMRARGSTAAAARRIGPTGDSGRAARDA